MDERMGRLIRDEAAHLAGELNMNHEHSAADLLRADARFGPDTVKAISYQAMAMSAPQSDHILLTGARDGGVDIALQHQRDGYVEQPKRILHITPNTQEGPEMVLTIPPVDQRFQPPPPRGQYYQAQPGQYVDAPPPPPPPNNEAACTAGGAVAGGLVGNLIGDRHNRTGTTILGAIAGAVVGNKACENR
jgi:hypothetical protein